VAIIEPSTGVGGSPKRILVVDDEKGFRTVLRAFVESLGYTCVEAESAGSALRLLKRTHFPIVISDIIMPEMDGLELLRIIKKTYSDVDVLIVTAYAGNYSPMKIVQEGASDFLAKPFGLDQLAARLYKIEMEKALRNKLYLKTITDTLTGLYNRGHCFEKLKGEIERARRQGYPISMIMLDVDGFKEFNDKYGHLRGDALLRTVARIIQFSVREHVDAVFRYGGDEFVVILPETDEETAAVIGSRIKKNFIDTAPANLTFSMGVAELEEGFDVETLINLADKRMYQEKLKAKGLGHLELQMGIEKDDHTVRCLSCGNRVHWTSSVCENCLNDPLRRTDSSQSQEIARTFFREVNPSFEDRRRSPRIRIRETILVRGGLEAMLHNISLGGAQIETRAPLSVGNALDIALPLEVNHPRFSGVIVYVQSLTEVQSLAGIRFSDISDQDSQVIKRFLDRHPAKKP
jgi:diguanylate cyclase (GGDEF)-like protein